MDPIGKILQGRADDLDLGRQDELALIQTELDRLFDGKARATRLDYQQGTLTIEPADSSVATLVRYGYVRIMASIKDLTRQPISRLIIRVR
jgi:hypothetical protein